MCAVLAQLLDVCSKLRSLNVNGCPVTDDLLAGEGRAGERIPGLISAKL